jgi:hypothetical protein
MSSRRESRSRPTNNTVIWVTTRAPWQFTGRMCIHTIFNTYGTGSTGYAYEENEVPWSYKN